MSKTILNIVNLLAHAFATAERSPTHTHDVLDYNVDDVHSSAANAGHASGVEST